MVSYEDAAREILLSNGYRLDEYGESDISDIITSIRLLYGEKNYIDGKDICNTDDFEGQYSVSDLAESILELSQMVYTEIDDTTFCSRTVYRNNNGEDVMSQNEWCEDFDRARDRTIKVYSNVILCNKNIVSDADWEKILHSVYAGVYYVNSDGDTVEYWRPSGKELYDMGWNTVYGHGTKEYD